MYGAYSSGRCKPTKRTRAAHATPGVASAKRPKQPKRFMWAPRGGESKPIYIHEHWIFAGRSNSIW